MAVHTITHVPAGERAAQGRARRAEVPRSSHAQFAPAPDRPDPVELLERQAQSRVPELVPVRHGRMVASAFAFFRGAAAVMAADLASTPHSGLQVQCCGDAHLSNFGVFASPERRLVFDVNDFDETLPGPWEWDVKRLAASLAIAAAENGYAVKDQERVVLDAVRAYRTAMHDFAAMRHLDVWYARAEVEEVLRKYAGDIKRKQVARTERQLARARTRDSLDAFAKLTETVDGEVRIADRSPLVVPITELAGDWDPDELFAVLRDLFRTYRQSLPYERRVLLEGFELHDFARKVVGVGSVGTRSWIALLLGRDSHDPLFLQLKEAEASVLEPYAGASGFANHGERVVAGQRLMQGASDIFLGWVRVDRGVDGQSRDFYGRQLKDWKASAEIEQMVPRGMAAYARLCGWTLARAHARSGDRIAIAAYLGRGDAFDRALVTFAQAYAEQNALDHAALAAAIDTGRVTAQLGV